MGGTESLVLGKCQDQLDPSFVCLVRKQKHYFSLTGDFLLHCPRCIPSSYYSPFSWAYGWTPSLSHVYFGKRQLGKWENKSEATSLWSRQQKRIEGKTKPLPSHTLHWPVQNWLWCKWPQDFVCDWMLRDIARNICSRATCTTLQQRHPHPLVNAKAPFSTGHDKRSAESQILSRDFSGAAGGSTDRQGRQLFLLAGRS